MLFVVSSPPRSGIGTTSDIDIRLADGLVFAGDSSYGLYYEPNAILKGQICRDLYRCGSPC